MARASLQKTRVKKDYWLDLGGHANPYCFRRQHKDGWRHYALQPEAEQYAKEKQDAAKPEQY